MESTSQEKDNAFPQEPLLSSAEKLMRQHHQHLSYEEINSANKETDRPTNYNKNPSKKQPDLDSETAFPSLGTPAAVPKTTSGWGAAPALSSRPLAGNFQKTNLSHISQFTETLVLLLASIHIGPVPPQYREKGPRAAGEKREEDPKTLPDVLRVVQKRHPTVTLESSTSRDRVTIIFRTPVVLPTPTSSTPSSIRAAASLAPEERIVRARQELITRVTRKIEKIIKIPASVKPFVIGQRGRVLKEIIEITGANINLPPKDGNRQNNIDSSTTHDPSINTPTTTTTVDSLLDESELIPITIHGEESTVLDAEDRIMMIVKEHTNKINLKIKSIPVEFYPLLSNTIFSKRSESDFNLIQTSLTTELRLPENELNCQVDVPSIHQIFDLPPSHLSLSELESNSNPTKGLSTCANKEILPITISGDRQQAEYAANFLQSTAQNFSKSTTKVELELPKRQHKFLDNGVIEQIFESTRSIVILPPPNDPSEKVIIRGENMSNVQALGLVVQKANEFKVEGLDLKVIHPKLDDPSGYANALVTYLSNKVHQTKLKQIQEEWSPKGVKIYIPVCSSADFSTTIEISGRDSESIKHVKQSLENYIRVVMKPEYFVTLKVDRLLHGHVLKKKNPRLKVLLDHNGIEMILPNLNNENDPNSSMILLVATKLIVAAGNKDSSKTINHSEIISNLNKAKEEILKSIKELAEIKSIEISIPSNLHDRILGPNQTTLNVIIGEDKLVKVTVEKNPTNNASSDILVNIRGSKDEVDRVEKEINQKIEEAQVTEVINSYSTEFEIDSKLVSHLVGKGGSAISKLGEELGIRVSFSDQINNHNSNSVDDSNHHHHHHHTNSNNLSNSKKSKKNHHSKVLVTISGRKENVEEAKKRIVAQAERLADEVTITLPLLAGLDRGALIGKGGMYITRLQDTHMVHINMPRGRKAGAENAANGIGEADITIRGPRKGVEAVKREFIELMEYEREQGNLVSIDIPTKSVSRIVGRGGAQANKIKEDSGLQSLDIDKLQSESDSNDMSRVTLKGSKAAILAAKKSINLIVQGMDDECVVEIKIPRAYHQVLIGKGGARLRELVKMAGAEETATKLIHFPKNTTEEEIVTIKGDKNIVPKIEFELKEEIKRLNEQVVYGLNVPKNSQPSLIGRGASVIKSLQSKHKVTILVPGWSQWNSTDPILNHQDLVNVESDQIFKIIGNNQACLNAIADLKSKIVVKDRIDRSNTFKHTLLVPAQFHHLLSQNGRFVRGLPKGVRIDHGSISIPNPFKVNSSEKNSSVVTPSARIDVSENFIDSPGILSWDLQEVQLGDTKEIPWNISGAVEEDVTNLVKSVEDKLTTLKSQTKDNNNKELDGKIYMVTCKVRRDKMPGIIGKSGLGLRNLIEKSNDSIWIEVIGKVNSDTLQVLGPFQALNSLKLHWDQLFSS